MSRQDAPQREMWPDVMRAIAAFLVVWIHTSSAWLPRWGEVPGRDWHVANLADSASRFGLPLFFMLTGYLLLKQSIALKDYFRKRFSRILIPWVAWSGVYILWGIFYKAEHKGLLGHLYDFLSGGISFHFWFLYVLVGLYLVIPVLSWMIDAAQPWRFLYFTVVWFIGASLIPCANSLLTVATGQAVSVSFDLKATLGFSGYLTAGFFLGRMKLDRRILAVCALVLAASVAFTALSTWYLTARRGQLEDYFYNYLSPNVVCMAVAGFLLLRALGERIGGNPRVAAVARTVSSASFGIYLLHPIILQVIHDGALGASLARFADASAAAIPAIALLAFLLSGVIVHALSRVPVLRATV